MKTDNSNQKDVALSALLREWKPEATIPPRFQEHVWRRIERAEIALAPPVSLSAVFADWLTNLLSRPAPATAFLTVLLSIGASVGWTQARQESASVTGELSARYVQAIDPYQTTPRP